MTVSAEMIDRALGNGVKPKDIALVYNVPVSTIMARVRVRIADSEREAAAKEAERMRLADEYRLRQAKLAKVMPSDEERLAAWIAKPLRYGNSAASIADKRGRYIHNTLKARLEISSYGVSHLYDERAA
jgi:hypothetical protein